MIRVITDGVLAASLLFGLPMSGAAAQEPDSTPAFTGIEGRWEGLLGGRLRLVVDIIRTQDGLFFGTLTSVDQGGTEVPIGRIDVDGDAVRFPPALRHRLTFGDQALEGMVPVVEETTAVLGPPLRGGPWYAANGPSNSAGHRRALVPLEGEAFIAQRYAIDWAKVGDNGQAFEGDGSDNEAYFGYGEAVLAVSDALVEAVRDGIAENAVLHVTLGRSTLYDMKTAAVTIRLDPSLEEMLDRVCRDTGRSRSEVVREALRRQLTLELFEEARRQLIPFAEAQGIYTDEDVFKLVS
jgi:predicted transcriptional regulator